MKTQTIIYRGMELPVFKSESPHTFGNEGKLMAVSNDGGPCIKAEVLAYVPSRDYPVITKDRQYRYCAELPDIPKQVNSYVTCKNSMLVRGMVSTVVCNAACGKTEVLCKNAADAYLEGNSVLYISMESPSHHILERCVKLAWKQVRSERDQEYGLPVDSKEWTDANPPHMNVVQGAVNINTCSVKSLLHQYFVTQGVTPDILIIDNISLMKPKHCFGIKVRERVYSELVNIAREANIAIITAEHVKAVIG